MTNEPPKALSRGERRALERSTDGQRLLALIDSLTARTEAEQDEQIVVDLQIATEAELRAELARRGLK